MTIIQKYKKHHKNFCYGTTTVQLARNAWRQCLDQCKRSRDNIQLVPLIIKPRKTPSTGESIMLLLLCCYCFGRQVLFCVLYFRYLSSNRHR
ncbi:hypothetical protein QL285_051381 [Trifolium repens]|nr:hypothetical protein QL285_051381 [Trifolium repens]